MPAELCTWCRRPGARFPSFITFDRKRQRVIVHPGCGDQLRQWAKFTSTFGRWARRIIRAAKHNARGTSATR